MYGLALGQPRFVVLTVVKRVEIIFVSDHLRQQVTNRRSPPPARCLPRPRWVPRGFSFGPCAMARPV